MRPPTFLHLGLPGETDEDFARRLAGAMPRPAASTYSTPSRPSTPQAPAPASPSAPALPSGFAASTQATPSAAAAGGSAEPNDSDMCVICLSEPRTVGFLHGSTVRRAAGGRERHGRVRPLHPPVLRMPLSHLCTRCMCAGAQVLLCIVQRVVPALPAMPAVSHSHRAGAGGVLEAFCGCAVVKYWREDEEFGCFRLFAAVWCGAALGAALDGGAEARVALVRSSS